MKIFFTASFEGKKLYQKYIDRIIQIIESSGAEIVSPEKSREYKDAFREENVKKLGDPEKVHYEFIRQGIANADAIIIEASQEDFRIGHEATLAIIYKKPVLCLSINKDYGKLVRHEDFRGAKYTENNLKKLVLDFIDLVSKRILSKRRSFLKTPEKVPLYRQKSQNKTIAVLGSINIDMVTKVARYPKADEAVISEGLKLVLGGKATNAAVGISRLDSKAYIIGKVGNDFFGEETKGLFNREGVNTQYVDIDSFNPTGTIMIAVDKKGKAALIVNEDANIRINKNTILDFLKEVDAKKINLDCFYTTLEATPDLILLAIRECSKRNITIFCDAAPAARPLDSKYYKYIEFLSANEFEAKNMTGIKVIDFSSAQKAGLELQKKGANNVIITLGEKGAILLEKNTHKFTFYAGKKVKPVDETAAGDAFRAAFITEYLQTKNLYQAMEFANLVGAYSVTKLGAYEAMPTRQELEFFQY